MAPLRTERHEEVRSMGMTTSEKGVRELLRQALREYEKGMLEGRRSVLREQLEARFGPFSPVARDRFEGLGTEQLDALIPGVFNAQSLRELGLED
jgi:hypothetical protein